MLDIIFVGLKPRLDPAHDRPCLAITYGAMGVIDMAHGDLVIVGVYATVVSSISLHLGFLAAVPVAFVVTTLIGWRSALDRPPDGRLLDTFSRPGASRFSFAGGALEFGASFFGKHIEGLGTGLQKVNVPAWMSVR